jgi:hypothetical protein
MARKNDEWLVTHLITAEKIERKDEEWGVAEYFGAAVVIFIVLAILGALSGH